MSPKASSPTSSVSSVSTETSADSKKNSPPHENDSRDDASPLRPRKLAPLATNATPLSTIAKQKADASGSTLAMLKDPTKCQEFMNSLDFSNIKLPEGTSKSTEKMIIGEVVKAALKEQFADKTSLSSASLKDIEVMRERDTKPLAVLFDPSNPDTWWTNLTELKGRRNDVTTCWSDVTFFTFKGKKVDILHHFSDMSPANFLFSAKSTWKKASSKSKAQDGQSRQFSCSCLATLLLKSCEDKFRLRIEQAIGDKDYLNDGPLVLSFIFSKFFPNPNSFQLAVTERLMSVSLESCNGNLAEFCSQIRMYKEMAPIDPSKHLELVTHVCGQLATYELEIVRFTFQLNLFKLYSEGAVTHESITLDTILNQVDLMDSMSTNPALQFFRSTGTANAQSEQLAAMATNINKLGSLVTRSLGIQSNITHRMDEGFKKVKANEQKTSTRAKHNFEKPSWHKEKPSDLSQVREFNGAKWRFCETCEFWSTTHTKDGIPSLNIPAHKGKKRVDNKTETSSQPPAKKQKPNGTVTNLKALKAEATKLQTDNKALAARIQAAGKADKK